MKRDWMRRGLGCLGLAITILGGCSGDEERAAPAASLDGDGTALPPLEKLDKDPCAVPTSTSCPCSDEGTQIDCGSVHEIRGDYVICSVGVRTCQSGLWSECQAQQLTEEEASARSMTTDGYKLLSLGAAADCNNLCDPECMSFVDDATNLTVSSNLQASSDGLTLPLVGSGGNCSAITISPASKTINITAIATSGAITISPSTDSTVTFSATCGSGVPVQPSWTIDSYDRAQINVNGQLSVFSGIGSPIVVSAASSQNTATALVSLTVNIADSASSAFNSQTSFATDTGHTLYPYKNTVFPLDLKAPLVQWDANSQASSKTQVALRYPAGSTAPTFWYSKVYTTADPNEGTLVTSSAPAWAIPQEIWSAFDRSAAGSSTGGEIIIRRYYSSAYHEMKIGVKFASQPLYGTVYYTQYARTLQACSTTTNQTCTYSSSYTLGQTCEVGIAANASGANTSMIRAVDLSQKSAPNSDPYGGTASCPVCHSVSSNGSVFVSGNQGWQGSSGSKGVNTISLSATGSPTFTAFGAPDNGLAPTYTGLSDTGSSNSAGDPYNNYERTGENSRGFSYAAITPDGSIVMQGPMFWGNTQEYPAANNTQNAAITGLKGYTKPYFFAKTAQPGIGVQFATTTALTYTVSSGTLKESGSTSALTVDGQSLVVGQSVLVKDETSGNAKNNGIYVLTALSNPWVLTRRTDADTAGELTGGMEVRVSDGTTNHGKVFYISTPSTSSTTITPGTTSISFSPRTYPGMAFGRSPFTVAYATTTTLPGNGQTLSPNQILKETLVGALPAIDGVTPHMGDLVLVKDEGSGSASTKNGIYTVSNLGSLTTQWILTRALTADATGELNPLQEIQVTGGTVNAGKVFYVSTPASGTLTLGTSSNTATLYAETIMPTMMVPVFSPGGTKVAYVNGDADSTYGWLDTGWRRGLTVMNFNQSTMTLSSKERVVNTWNSGTAGIPIKWPFFEDERSLLFVETETTEYCSQSLSDHTVTVNTADGRGCFEGAYGSMSPTTRGHWKGTIYAVDTNNITPTTLPTPVKLANMTNGEDATDFDHSYQPTVLPNTVGGYHWVIFTSTRAYGNQFNQKGTDFSCTAPLLWMAALDTYDTTASTFPTNDRSHPAFLVPGQNMTKITTTGHYLNERGYLVPTPCKGSGVSCSADEECCGGSATPQTAACRAPTSWTPASGTPAKTCAALSGTCSNTGQSCSTPADCCNHTDCTNFKCAAPPSYTTASFDRDYTATCPDGYQPDWKVLSYYLTNGNGSSIVFSIKTATTAAGLATAPSLALTPAATDTVVSPATPESRDVETLLENNHANGRNYLRLDVDLIPSTDGQTAPVLHDWEMYYTCEAAQ